MVNETLNESLRGRVAVVTGATSGIGRAVGRSLVARGVKVGLVARRREVLEDLAASLGGPERARAAPADVSDEAQAADALAAVRDHFGGRLDLLVNAAGIARVAPLSTGATADWREMWEVNVLGTAIMTRAALAYFPEAGGHVVNLCSLSGHRVPGKGGFYPATKFAVRAMTEGLRQELRLAGNRTRVSQVSPGFVETPMLDEYFGSLGTTPQAAVDYRMLQPEDIAAAVIHLLEQPPHVEINDLLLRPAEQGT